MYFTKLLLLFLFMKFITALILFILILNHCSFSQNQKVINNKDTLFTGCANHVTRPKGAEKLNCFLQYENEPVVTPNPAMASFVDYGKKIYISPPHEGLFSMDYGKNDSTIAVSVIYNVVNPPLPVFEVYSGGQSFKKDNVKIFRGQKIQVFLKNSPKLPITDRRYHFSEIKILYYKDLMQSTPSRTEDYYLPGTAEGFELDTKYLKIKDFSMIKIQIGEIQRVAYNQERFKEPFSKYDLAINVHFNNDTLKTAVAPPRPQAVQPSGAPKKPPVTQAPVAETPKSDILYLIDRKGKIPSADLPPRVESPATITNLDSVMRLVNFPVLYKKLGSDNTLTVKVLVDENGKYKDHLIVKESHPSVNTRVCAFLPLLRFIPASHRGAKVLSWVTIPVVLRKE